MSDEMTQDLDLFFYYAEELTTRESKGEDFPIPTAGQNSFGDLYLRCDVSNPGGCFASIELLAHRHLISVSKILLFDEKTAAQILEQR